MSILVDCKRVNNLVQMAVLSSLQPSFILSRMGQRTLGLKIHFSSFITIINILLQINDDRLTTLSHKTDD